MRDYRSGNTYPGGRPPSFFSPLYEPSTFPTDNLAARMKNRVTRFPSRMKVIKSPIASPEPDPNPYKGWNPGSPPTTFG